ncbi:DUF389 domain-containing protein [Luteibaculum oceani]|uniref:DUF389 domain-containing protein n=1 Tax=Luteibaculum oceani TaxID=1294296 RepID=A0A5C6VE18_9FLAO|nr:DUF389 domain-containing protein [Luteibaculum oceani]TXC81995.1 DUF389 domain-containing protein [Luteibaculum oceani]
MAENGNLNPEEETQEELKRINFSLKRVLVSIIKLFKSTFNIREGAQIKETSDGIKRDISFKGHNSWILVFSIFIASIGLNVNSIPVVIGAMLISPLMGPILGLGLAVGTNDWETLTRSLKNFGIMILIALATSTLYFSLSPLTEITSELLGRVKPTILDVFVATFGGLAGIVAGSRKEKSNVVPGVAIATALMPPLCTAGYGLAIGSTSVFFGAMYLFLLNSVFICITTFLVIRFLKFPLVEFVDTKKEKRIRLSITIFVIVVMVPSAFIFYDVIKETIYNRNVRNFLAQELYYEGAEIINEKVVYSDDEKAIDIFLIGERVPEGVIQGWRKKMETYDLADAQLTIHQSKDETVEIAGKVSEQVKSGIIQDLYEKNEALLASKDERIEFLENQVVMLGKRDTMALKALYNEAKILYPWVEAIEGGYVNRITTGSSKNLPLVITYYTKNFNPVIDSTKYNRWVRARLKEPRLKVKFIKAD